MLRKLTHPLYNGNESGYRKRNEGDVNELRFNSRTEYDT